MLEHVSAPVRDAKKAKRFYATALKPLGYRMNYDFPDAAGFKEGGHTSFWVVKKKRVEPIHVAFLAKSKKQVGDFHKAALKAGARDNGGPGFRLEYGRDYYAAFILDPDGNNIEACYFGAQASRKK